MALFDFLKIKKARQKRKAHFDGPATISPKASLGGETQKPVSAKKRHSGFSYEIVKEPHISEKATNLAESNQYVFKVVANSNKTEIKKSVEGIYGVNVLSVNIIKIPAKKRRIGKTQGFKKGHTKAVVKIAEGQKIEIL